MINETKHEHVYTTYKLEGKYYEMSFSTDNGVLGKTWITLRNESKDHPFTQTNVLGSISSIDHLIDLQEIVEKSIALIEREGLAIIGADTPDDEVTMVEDALA